MKGKGLSRIAVALCLFGLWVIGIGARLYQLQIVQHDDFEKRADRQQQRVLALDPPRGTIYDVAGRELAVSVEVESLAAVPRDVKDAAATARSLARVLELDAAKLQRQLESDREFVWLARKLDPPVVERVRALELKGLRFLPESKRYYPLRALAASVLGYVGTDNKGLAGLEAEYDAEIKGRLGRRTVLRDARRGTVGVPDLDSLDPQPGRDIHLTLDASLQYVVERELEATVQKFSAKSGAAVFLDPRTGAVRAMATYPSFDANDYRSYHEEERRNRPVMDAYEPGSTFKMITGVAALEANAVDPSDVFDCQQGSIQLYGIRINDHKPFGMLSMRDVLAQSSNVGAIKIGLAAGQERLYGTLRAFGFGEPSGVDLPGESPGIVRTLDRWVPAAKAYASFGQGLSVTAIQLAAAFAAAGNGGKLLRPYVVAAIDEAGPTGSGHERRELHSKPTLVRQVASAATLRSMDRMLQAVISDGTGKAAGVPGFVVAGKTGTSEKAGKGGYVAGRYIASFAGYAPARDPILAGVVVIDEPRGGQYHGGDVAAPIFGAVARQALLDAGTTPSRDVPERWPREREAEPSPDARDTVLASVAADASTQVSTAVNAAVDASVGAVAPDLVGLTAREALRVARVRGVVARVRGQGFVVEQQPGAGEPLSPGQVVTLALALEKGR
jgi:cell division protein FtsI (penicillin-binding protein 3)